jgi:hypothetical protein
MNSYRVFTVASGEVIPGAAIDILHLKGAGMSIPAIIIGEEGRGRERGVVPVSDPPIVPCPDRGRDIRISSWAADATKCDKCGVTLGPKKEGRYACTHPDEGQVQGRLMFAEVGQTKAGKPKFITRNEATSDHFIIVVFTTHIWYRGENNYTGDFQSWRCPKVGCDASGTTSTPAVCPKCGAAGWSGPQPLYENFPGQIIARGYIAQGEAGAIVGGGEELVALMPKNIVFRTAYWGRLYGAPDAHYYKWDGEKLMAATWDERTSADLF